MTPFELIMMILTSAILWQVIMIRGNTEKG